MSEFKFTVTMTLTVDASSLDEAKAKGFTALENVSDQGVYIGGDEHCEIDIKGLYEGEALNDVEEEED